MKPHILILILLLCGVSACQTQKTTIFVDQTWNRSYAKTACDIYKHNYGAACVKTPQQMATELKARLSSAAQKSPACKNMTISYEPVGEETMKEYLDGWSLTLNVGIGGRDIDYSRSVWSMLDNKTKKRFDGFLWNSVEAATQICTVATRRGS